MHLIYNDLLNLLSNQECFIEAEAQQDTMLKFINKYNQNYNAHLTLESNGLIVLKQNANKWGVELRLYVHNCPNDIKMKYKFTGNRAYRSEYSFRLNNNKIINELFKSGYRIGLNS